MSVGAGKTVVIVGAGLAGTLLACYLARLGYRVDIYERRPDPRAAGYIGGRSINLALSVRGIRGLAGAGLADRVLRDAIPMRGRMIHPPTARDAAGDLPFQAYSKNASDAIHSVSRGGLNSALLDAAEELPGVTIRFDHRCVDVDLAAPAAEFVGPGGASVPARADLVIGADGAFSPVRAAMQKTDRFDYSQSYLEHGYKELHIPPRRSRGTDGVERDEFAMSPDALHIWPRGSSMMIALPNPDKSFTCTLFWPFAGPHSFDSLRTREHVERFFSRHYPDAAPLMPTLVDDYLRNPTSSLLTVRCCPWRVGGKAVILGDAAHAIVPFFGQGMNCAFEDCRTLAECLEKHRGDADPALDEFQALRKPNADAIADMALANFIEMRDKVASPLFRARKKVEHALHAVFPESCAPLYNLVSFSTIPYAEAQRRGRRMTRRLELAAMALTGGCLALLSLAAWGLLR